MRDITRDAIQAFRNSTRFKRRNTEIKVLRHVTIMLLHGNKIAYKYNDPQNTIEITNCGWESNTTKERLNAIQGVSITQKNFVWYLNGKKWDGNLIEIEK